MPCVEAAVQTTFFWARFLFGHYKYIIIGVCGGLGVGVSMEAFQIEFESFIDALSRSFRSSKNHILTMPFYLYQMANQH